MSKTQVIFLAVILLAAAAIGIFIFSTHKTTKTPNSLKTPTAAIQPTEEIIPTETPTPTKSVSIKTKSAALQPTITPLIPIIDCVGPDGKHLANMTQEECNIFNNAWATNTPTPQ